jgi:hypothetical protein
MQTAPQGPRIDTGFWMDLGSAKPYSNLGDQRWDHRGDCSGGVEDEALGAKQTRQRNLLLSRREGAEWPIDATGRLRPVALETPLSRCQSSGIASRTRH